MRRLALAIFSTLSALLLVQSLLVVTAEPASAAVINTSMEADFAKLINQERTARGLPALPVSLQMRDVSVSWSGVMASQNRLFHNPNLAAEVSRFDVRWQRLGENVGYGYDVASIHRAFMNSQGHRDNILGTWKYLSVGVVVDGNRVWVTENFIQTANTHRTTSAASSAPSSKDAVWLMRDSATPGSPDRTVAYGLTTYQTLSCDWDGNGTDTIGVYSNGVFYLRNDNQPGPPHLTIPYGWNGPTAVCGDWNGDGVDTIGLYNAGQWLLRDSNTPGSPHRSFLYGWGGATPVVGNWDGRGADGIAVYSAGGWSLRQTASSGHPEIAVSYGYRGAMPVAGDWDGDGKDSIGVFDRGSWNLRQDTSPGPPHVAFSYGWAATRPVLGDWDGDRKVGVGVIPN